ncbi:MAG: Hsp20 family protein [Lachnospiraceae bacterium]|nr:Hsp20 family protein [Lachnospiraceae bacterium]
MDLREVKGDLRERDDLFVLEVEMPGFEREQISACTNDGYLIVTAQRQDMEEPFRRAFYIGKGVAGEQIRAAYRNNTLKIMMPKQEESGEVQRHFILIE